MLNQTIIRTGFCPDGYGTFFTAANAPQTCFVNLFQPSFGCPTGFTCQTTNTMTNTGYCCTAQRECAVVGQVQVRCRRVSCRLDTASVSCRRAHPVHCRRFRRVQHWFLMSIDHIWLDQWLLLLWQRRRNERSVVHTPTINQHVSGGCPDPNSFLWTTSSGTTTCNPFGNPTGCTAPSTCQYAFVNGAYQCCATTPQQTAVVNSERMLCARAPCAV